MDLFTLQRRLKYKFWLKRLNQIRKSTWRKLFALWEPEDKPPRKGSHVIKLLVDAAKFLAHAAKVDCIKSRLYQDCIETQV